MLSLRSFEREELALHNVFGEIGATSPDSLMIDLRGNIGGELCHVFELAYLVSNKFKSVQEAQVGSQSCLRTPAYATSVALRVVLSQTAQSLART